MHSLAYTDKSNISFTEIVHNLSERDKLDHFKFNLILQCSPLLKHLMGLYCKLVTALNYHRVQLDQQTHKHCRLVRKLEQKASHV